MKLTKDDKAMLKQEYMEATGNEADADRYLSRTSGYIVFRGVVIEFDKPHIKTRFCFGEHGYDYDEVLDTCDRMSKSEKYFIEENLRWTKAGQMLGILEDRWARVAVNPKEFFRQSENCHLGYVRCFKRSDELREGEFELNEQEVKELVQFLEEEQEKFEKRLHSYLKRYGMSKCYFWTYWADR